MHSILTALFLAAPLPSDGVHYVLEGPGAGVPAFGNEVADLADLDGDGVRDLAIGLSDGPGQGRILLVSGRDGTRIRTIDSTAGTGSIGSGIANVGDVDGDGFEDIGTIGNAAVPQVVVFSGATGGLVLSVQVPLVAVPKVIGAGDVNGDGKGDVLFSDPQVATVLPCCSFATGAGQVRVLSGADGSTLQGVTGSFLGQALGALSLALGDVDADGVPDWALVDSGRLFVLSGASGERIRSLPFGSFSSNVARVGDLDGDGQDDLVFTGFNRSRAVSTGTWLDLWTHSRPFIAWGGNAAISAASAGDVDGDGTDDVILGYDDPTGDAHVGLTYQGPGQVDVVSGADGSQLASFTGTEMDQGYGSSVGALGDIDGDGMLDVWIASPRWERDGEVVGAIEVRSALDALSGPARICVAGVNSQGTSARLTSSGTTSVANNDLVFTVTGGVPNETAVLLYGRRTGARMLGGGTLCIADEVYRVRGGRFNVQGGFVAPLDLNALPEAPIGAGSTWNFQVWYRSQFNPGLNAYLPRVNLSDAIRVPFVP